LTAYALFTVANDPKIRIAAVVFADIVLFSVWGSKKSYLKIDDGFELLKLFNGY